MHPEFDTRNMQFTVFGFSSMSVPEVPPNVWDFILSNNSVDLEKFLFAIAELDSTQNTNVLQRVLDQRVNQASRFKFYNPIYGQHGWYHVLTEDRGDRTLIPPLSSPLHYAVHIKALACVPVLLQYNADLTLLDEKDQGPFNIAKLQNDPNMLQLFKQSQTNFASRRKQMQYLELLNKKLKEDNANAMALLAEIEKDREAYKSRVREATLKACNYVVSVTLEKLTDLGENKIQTPPEFENHPVHYAVVNHSNPAEIEKPPVPRIGVPTSNRGLPTTEIHPH